MKQPLPKIQFITHATERYTLAAGAELALRCGIRWVQFRCKDELKPAVVETLALDVQALCRRHHAIFVIDDRVDLALKLKADGVHLGKEDMPVDEARRLLGPNYIIGGTANTWDDMVRLQQQGADYIGLGPYRFTQTKKKLSPVLGLEGYADIMVQAKKNRMNLPVYAIGGITSTDASALRKTGVYGLALSSSILQAEEPFNEVEKFNKTFICKN